MSFSTTFHENNCCPTSKIPPLFMSRINLCESHLLLRKESRGQKGKVLIAKVTAIIRWVCPKPYEETAQYIPQQKGPMIWIPRNWFVTVCHPAWVPHELRVRRGETIDCGGEGQMERGQGDDSIQGAPRHMDHWKRFVLGIYRPKGSSSENVVACKFPMIK
jgi:hypothetical protein